MSDYRWETQPDGTDRAVIRIAFKLTRLPFLVQKHFPVTPRRESYGTLDEVDYYLTDEKLWIKGSCEPQEYGIARLVVLEHPIQVAHDFFRAREKVPAEIEPAAVSIATDRSLYDGWIRSAERKTWYTTLASVTFPVDMKVLDCSRLRELILALAWPPTSKALSSRQNKILSPCESDCIEIIRKHGKTLKYQEILKHFESNNMIHADCTVRTALARLANTEVGLLTSGRGRASQGYGLPEWNSPSLDDK
jgi:hypothetical protein